MSFPCFGSKVVFLVTAQNSLRSLEQAKTLSQVLPQVY
uniref:Uncharacterized protein n=1 Tax=Brassica oleracea TaxID=3712 RepID=A0A3P6E276_BRAOL|nr:unnamed protein product [Brassica oleracea]